MVGWFLKTVGEHGETLLEQSMSTVEQLTTVEQFTTVAVEIESTLNNRSITFRMIMNRAYRTYTSRRFVWSQTSSSRQYGVDSTAQSLTQRS